MAGTGTKKRWYDIDHPIKIVVAGAVIGGIWYAYNKYVPRRKVKFNKNDLTEFTSYAWYDVNEENPIHWTFDPADTATWLHSTMKGGGFFNKEAFKFISRLQPNDLRALHNKWLSLIDKDESIYDWINQEWNFTGEGAAYMIEMLKRLNLSGVGERNVLIAPTPAQHFTVYNYGG